MSQWQNPTLYDGTTVREPRTIEYQTESITVIVTRHIYQPHDVWTLVCPHAGIGRITLINKDLRAAQREALGIVLEKLNRMSVEVATGILAT